MMTDLLLILGLLLLAAFFWQLRQMAEISRLFAEKECRRQRVQLLDIAMLNARPTLGGDTGICWKSRFIFDFSTDGLNQFQGQIHMIGKRITKIEWPIFPEPEWSEAPNATGRFGGCGGQSCQSGKCK
ncbi:MULTISPECIES: DUF3301 domain-containing protein [Shewanella]|uniref:DUF3301 domain-containing protein n=2 Tax=Shewanella TaxID=22 RepID=A0A974XPU5_9GAMM|nr:MULTISPECIES: DUF3301 domain-containing protein [Shewanella]QSX31061.1 DUF3301 domain-containing protein [Shewanella cyperi]QSX38290.1 DUF3301 domain-containing protein [Shewanella sedimentimangrovi]QSX41844.1 DUF3301 domain-containing protein [Shewanella cyperi]